MLNRPAQPSESLARLRRISAVRRHTLMVRRETPAPAARRQESWSRLRLSAAPGQCRVAGAESQSLALAPSDSASPSHPRQVRAPSVAASESSAISPQCSATRTRAGGWMVTGEQVAGSKSSAILPRALPRGRVWPPVKGGRHWAVTWILGGRSPSATPTHAGGRGASSGLLAWRSSPLGRPAECSRPAVQTVLPVVIPTARGASDPGLCHHGSANVRPRVGSGTEKLVPLKMIILRQP